MTEGQIIANARTTAGYTQGEVASKLGFKTAQFVSNWERGKASVPKTHLKKLAKLIGVRAVKEIVDIRAKAYRAELLQVLN